MVNEIKEKERKSKSLPKFKEEDIRLVYFKTGFHYPLDKLVDADYKMSGQELYTILIKYEGESEILDDYILKLNSDLKFYGNIEASYAEGSIETVLKYHYGQYLLLKDMFCQVTSFSHGSSSGRPWSNHNIAVVPYIKNYKTGTMNKTFSIFCRIDKRKNTYYASLRQYDRKLDKRNNFMVDRKISAFNELRTIFKKTCESINSLKGDKSIKYKIGGNNGGYFESEFGIFLFGDKENQITIKEFIKVFHEFWTYVNIVDTFSRTILCNPLKFVFPLLGSKIV